MKSIVSVSAFIAVAFLPENAFSQCLPNSVSNGGVVICESDDSDGFDDQADRSDITVIVNPGVTVSSTDETMNIKGVRAALTNRGSISSTSSRAADLDGDMSTLKNFGEISGERDGVRLGNGATVTNHGTISSVTTQAVDADAGSNVTIVNTSSGRIQTDSSSGEEAIKGGPGLTVVNDGRIIAHLDDGVQATSGATIINSGTIRGGANDAIELLGGVIENSGRIFSTSSALNEQDAGIDFDASAEDGLVVNSNLICGEIGIGTDAANVGAQTIINSGTIVGTGGTALLLGDGDDLVIIRPGARFGGTINGGNGSNTLHIADGVSGAFKVEDFDQLDIRPRHRFGRNGVLIVGPAQTAPVPFLQGSCP